MNISTKLHEIPVEKIIPDPNQPRQTKNKDKVQKIVLELAAQIKTEGLINAIEVSRLPNDMFMIVTGEMRWTAVTWLIKHGDFDKKTITAKVIDIEPQGLIRFRRQVIENARRGSMTVMEMARSFTKLLNLTASQLKQMEMSEIKKKYSDEVDKIAQETGKGRQWIFECIGYLKEPDDVARYLETQTGKHAVIRGLNVIRNRNTISEEHKQILKNKVLELDITDRDVVLRLGKEIEAHPEKADLLLKESYKSGRTRNMQRMDEIIERRVVSEFETEQEQANRNAREVSDQLADIRLALENFPIRNVSRIQLETFFDHVALFKGDIDALYKGLEMILNQKQLQQPNHVREEVTYERT